MPADILIYALVAAGLVFWLRNILGTRHGGERDRANPFANPPPKADTTTAAAAPKADGGFTAETLPLSPDKPWQQELGRNMAVAEAAQTGLEDIARADRAFDLPHFLQGSQDAFVMIVEAFANGDRETLGNLLSPPILAAFERVLNDRTARGDVASVEIHAVRRAEILEARLDRRMAYITVKFTADETNIVRNKDGAVIQGNPDRVSETIDIWTFGRDVKSRDPAWLVFETRDEDAAASNQKTVPDHK